VLAAPEILESVVRKLCVRRQTHGPGFEALREVRVEGDPDMILSAWTGQASLSSNSSSFNGSVQTALRTLTEHCPSVQRVVQVIKRPDRLFADALSAYARDMHALAAPLGLAFIVEKSEEVEDYDPHEKGEFDMPVEQEDFDTGSDFNWDPEGAAEYFESGESEDEFGESEDEFAFE